MKKILTVFLALALLIACIPVCASATDTPAFSVGCGAADPGETVQIPVRIENNPGIMSCYLSVSYDKTLLTLESVDYANLFTGGSCETGGDLTLVPFNMLWYDFTENHYNNGDFMLLTFRVSASAAPGDIPVTLTYSADNTFDYDEQLVSFETQNGAVSVNGWYIDEDSSTLYTYEGDDGLNFICGINSLDDPFVSDYIVTTGDWSYEVEEFNSQESTGSKVVIYDADHNAVEEYYPVLFGDVNGDCSINGLDILLLMDMVTGAWGDFILSDEYPQTFAADLNHDGDVNGMDILCIMDCMSTDDAPFQFIED